MQLRTYGRIATRLWEQVPKPERIRFSELVTDVVYDYTENERSTTKDVKRRIELHLLSPLGNVRAAESCGTSHVKRYIERRKKAGAWDATINRELAIVKRVRG